MATITAPPIPETRRSDRYPVGRLVAGLIGRAVLWFLAASLALTLVPMLFGWGSFVIVTGSMEPGISAGDVVLVSPGYDEAYVAGRVITFQDPARDDNVLTHRVVSVGEDHSLITKGDANPTDDPTPVPAESVIGMGRLLVQFIGLPVVWFHTGNWLAILLLALFLGWSVVVTVLDHEPSEPKKLDWRLPTSTAMIVVVTAVAVGAGVTGGVSTAAFSAATANNGDSWSVPNWAYTTAVTELGPYLYWKLDETGNTATAADSSGNGRTGSYSPNGNSSNFTRLGDGALLTDTPDRAVRLNSANSCIHTTSSTAINAPQIFTVVAWLRAPSSYTDGGKLLGFERPRTGVSAPSTGAYDRHFYMDGQGRVWFGIYNDAHVTLNTPAGLNDGNWHMVVGTQSSAGMRLYLDGVQVGSNGNTVAETQTGWWRAGCGNLSGWGDQWGGGNNPGTDSAVTQNRSFRADLDEITVYNTALTAQQVAYLYFTR